VAERLRAGAPPAAIYSSPLGRALVTADAIGQALDLPVLPDDGLREMGLGAWEGLTHAEIGGGWGDTYSRWVRDPVGNPPPGGEPMANLGVRVTAAVERIRAAHGETDVVVVSHAGAIGAYLCTMLGLSLSNIFRFKLENASLTEVVVDWVGTRLALMNDTSHLRNGAGPDGIVP
jgi:probable phosphoglycerate mutase